MALPFYTDVEIHGDMEVHGQLIAPSIFTSTELHDEWEPQIKIADDGQYVQLTIPYREEWKTVFEITFNSQGTVTLENGKEIIFDFGDRYFLTKHSKSITTLYIDSTYIVQAEFLPNAIHFWVKDYLADPPDYVTITNFSMSNTSGISVYPLFDFTFISQEQAD